MQSDVPGSGNARRSRSPSPSSARPFRTRSPNHRRRLPLGSIPSRRDGRLSTHIATSINIRREGRIAITPCDFCTEAGVACYVGSLARKCAMCARAGRKVEMCGVDRHQYLEAPLIEEETFPSPAAMDGNRSSEPGNIAIRSLSLEDQGNQRPMAGSSSGEVSTFQSQIPSRTILDKLDRLGRRTKEGFRRVAKDVDGVEERCDGLEERMIVMEDIIADLQNQVKHLEGLLTTTRPRSPILDPSQVSLAKPASPRAYQSPLEVKRCALLTEKI